MSFLLHRLVITALHLPGGQACVNRSSIVWLAVRRQGIARSAALHLDCARSPGRGRLWIHAGILRGCYDGVPFLRQSLRPFPSGIGMPPGATTNGGSLPLQFSGDKLVKRFVLSRLWVKVVNKNAENTSKKELFVVANVNHAALNFSNVGPLNVESEKLQFCGEILLRPTASISHLPDFVANDILVPHAAAPGMRKTGDISALTPVLACDWPNIVLCRIRLCPHPITHNEFVTLVLRHKPHSDIALLSVRDAPNGAPDCGQYVSPAVSPRDYECEVAFGVGSIRTSFTIGVISTEPGSGGSQKRKGKLHCLCFKAAKKMPGTSQSDVCLSFRFSGMR